MLEPPGMPLTFAELVAFTAQPAACRSVLPVAT
jgi:hypothetical protein